MPRTRVMNSRPLPASLECLATLIEQKRERIHKLQDETIRLQNQMAGLLTLQRQLQGEARTNRDTPHFV